MCIHKPVHTDINACIYVYAYATIAGEKCCRDRKSAEHDLDFRQKNHIYWHTYTYICIYDDVCTPKHTFAKSDCFPLTRHCRNRRFVYVNICIRIYMCTHICIYIYVYVCMHSETHMAQKRMSSGNEALSQSMHVYRHIYIRYMHIYVDIYI